MCKGLGEAAPRFEIVEVNTMQQSDDEESDEDVPKKSSAYSQCQLEDQILPCIIDTVAGSCIISQAMLDRIRWEIDGPTRQILIVADGYTAVLIGKVKDLPIRFRKLIILTQAIVVDTTSYDLVIGNDWLKKI